MIAVDTNVLIHAHRSESAWHRAARARLVNLAEGPARWGLPVFCVAEFMRVVTHGRVFNPPSSVSQAAGFIDNIVAAPTCELVRPGAEFLDLLMETARQSDARGNLMFDAQIAALCREHGIDTVLTNDRDFERFDGLRVETLS
ncbi:MAG: PIN domain-containing protein [Chloroflexota bacterium]|nr:PIN domain-containing protein [Chloroflexota bacterium]